MSTERIALAPASRTARTARLVLAAFLLTFMSARILVFLIMSRRVPDLYVHVGGTHIHHLNYGIVLLSIVGAWLLFRHPRGVELTLTTTLYGVGMGLTFDEFGMWLHLGGPYWQRASFDAVIVIAALFGLIGFAPTLREFRPRHWATAALTTMVAVLFIVLLADSFRYAARIIGPRLQRIESSAPR
jgi:hypothetical protein